MSENKENALNMVAELFTITKPNHEFLLPPKSKEEYIKDIESCCTMEEKLFALKCLVEAYRFGGLNSDGCYSLDGCNELLVVLRKHVENINLREHVATTAFLEGLYCENVGDYSKAIKFYEVSLVCKLADLRARYFQYNNLAFCLNFSEKFSESEKLLIRAIAILPKQYNAWKNLGFSLEHQGQYEEAARCYLNAIFFSGGEHRSKSHLDRLLERHDWLKESSAIKEWVPDGQS